jgi:predicted Holliday junction resolvase-like endonuclease
MNEIILLVTITLAFAVILLYINLVEKLKEKLRATTANLETTLFANKELVDIMYKYRDTIEINNRALNEIFKNPDKIPEGFHISVKDGKIVIKKDCE